ncbi:hypothetical protein MKW98_015033 [Papaver atlanticum]|uniref:Uncharacterized protein n=1 Tax=Papaver atlanticum TaxID=357466 RepID=A0AAD4XAC4_9MAGN|nr:hypothetical protein MKW98_015033 [Papaver atlanticum]
MLLLMCTRATPSIVYEQHNHPRSEARSSDKANHDSDSRILQPGLAPKLSKSLKLTDSSLYAVSHGCPLLNKLE